MKGHVFGDPVLRVTVKDPAGKAAGSFSRQSFIVRVNCKDIFKMEISLHCEQRQECLSRVIRGNFVCINNLVATVCFGKVEGFVSNLDEVFMLVLVIR